MKDDLLEILACPHCPEAPLDLKVSEQCRNEIVSGKLKCSLCDEIYLIQEGIPRMIPRVKGKEGGNQNKPGENPQPQHYEAREANTIFYDSIAEVYDYESETEIRQTEANQKRIDQMVRSLADNTPKELFLDLGCGTGNVLKFGKKYFHRAIGLDVSFNMLKKAQQYGLEVVQGDIVLLPFKPSLFDLISTFSVLHHIYDYHLVFEQIGRVLKEGGYLYSDWDPAKKPLPQSRNISWGVYQLANNLYSLLRAAKGKLKLIIKWNRSKTDAVDFMKIRPDLKEIQAKAEFHNITPVEQRGIDFPEVKNRLLLGGFRDVQASYHENGLTLNQLSGVPFLRSKLLTFLGFDPEPFMENILILAQKKKNSPESITSACLEKCGKK